MGTYAEELEEYRRKMGGELGTAYHLLWNECALIHIRWDEYVEMFGKTQVEFDIMNGVASGFFKSVQDQLWESLLLHLCRFADPAKVGVRRTLSLATLLTMQETTAVPDIAELVCDARSRIKFAQDWRNRSIAHADLEYNLDSSAVPLAPASRLKVKEALEGIVAVLEAIDFHFTGSRLYFGGPSWNWGGAALLRELRLISILRKERDERIETGNPTADDLDYGKWH